MINLQWLQNWYKKNCNNHWEHEYGIVILSLENPGWRISIPLSYTNLEEKEFQKISIDRSEHDWIRCEVSKNLFVGAGGPRNLEELLTIFKMWAIQYKTYDHNSFHYQQYERWFQKISYRKNGKRLDLKGRVEYNKVTKSDIYSPYVHEDETPGGVRTATQEEIEKGI